jgi:hypothetical protein
VYIYVCSIKSSNTVYKVLSVLRVVKYSRGGRGVNYRQLNVVLLKYKHCLKDQMKIAIYIRNTRNIRLKLRGSYRLVVLAEC